MRQIRIWQAIGLVVGALLQGACGDEAKPSPTQPSGNGSGTGGAEVTAVVITNGPSQPLDLGDHVSLGANATLANGTTRDCAGEATWTSSDAKAATVAKGVVTVVGAGPVSVAATCNGKSASLAIPIDIRAHVTISGLVTDSTSGAGVQGAFVRLIVDGREGAELATGAAGAFAFDVPWTRAPLAVDVRGPGYALAHQPFELAGDRTTQLTVPLRRASSVVLARQGRLCYVNRAAPPDSQQRALDACHAAGYDDISPVRWHVGRAPGGQFVADVSSFSLDYEEYLVPTLICNGRATDMTWESSTEGPPASWSAPLPTTTVRYVAPADASCDYDLEVRLILRNRYYSGYQLTLTLQP